MKTTEYLYELDKASLEKMLYFDALQYKINCARRLWNKLNIESRVDHSFELNERMFYVWKAWKHTERLLEEKNNEWSET